MRFARRLTLLICGLTLVAAAPSLKSITPDLEKVDLMNVVLTKRSDGVELQPSKNVVEGSAESESRDTLATLRNVRFQDGEISVEVSGAVLPGAAPTARGFVGLAFRTDGPRYEAFYLRMTNGRADDQLRRNRSTQYVSHPEWPWARLRKETPAMYESYVDLVPGQWTKMRILVCGSRARMFVHGVEQPTLVVNDLKRGANVSGGVALWIGPGTLGRFRNLKVTHDPVCAPLR